MAGVCCAKDQRKLQIFIFRGRNGACPRFRDSIFIRFCSVNGNKRCVTFFGNRSLFHIGIPSESLLVLYEEKA